MNILFIADPNSIHDEKWVQELSKTHTTYTAIRKIHLNNVRNIITDKCLIELDDHSIKNYLKTIKTVYNLKKIINKNSIDIVHILYAEPNALWILYKLYFKTKFVLTTRGSDILIAINNFYQKKDLLSKLVFSLYSISFSLADAMTSTSSSQVDTIKKLFSKNVNSNLIRTGIDYCNVKLLIENSSRPQITGNYVLLPRRIHPTLNHEFAIHAISESKNPILYKYIFVLVGDTDSDSDYSILLKKLIRESDKKFIILGKQDQQSMFSLYKNSDAIIMTPKSDGSPVSAMEAIACNKPIIIGPIQYDLDIVTNVSYQLKAWDALEFIGSLINILKNNQEKEIERESINNINYVPSFDLKKNMNSILEIYENIMSK